MQITFNRNDLYRFERLVNKLVKPSELPVAAIFSPCSGGTMFIAFCENATLTLTVPDVSMTDTFSLPWSLYETLQNTRQLVRHLKQQRKQDRLVRNTLESLKQLQGIRV